jgi:hypothetical protein
MPALDPKRTSVDKVLGGLSVVLGGLFGVAGTVLAIFAGYSTFALIVARNAAGGWWLWYVLALMFGVGLAIVGFYCCHEGILGMRRQDGR